MNIFYLHEVPEIAAKMHCDKHVVKMVLESGQMLSTCFRLRHQYTTDENGHIKFIPMDFLHPLSFWRITVLLHHHNVCLKNTSVKIPYKHIGSITLGQRKGS